MKVKKILSSFLIAALIFPSFAIEASAQTYSDTNGHWAEKEVQKWSEFGVLQGNEGNFKPNNSLTRAEMAAILDRVMHFEEKAQNTFSDVGNEWYSDAILKCSAAGVLKGDGGIAMPNKTISRQEATVMICRTFDIQPKAGGMNFADENDIASWAKEYVNALSSLGFVSGVGDNKFAPTNEITRAEIVKILDNVVSDFYNKAGKYSKDTKGNVIINTAGVTLENMNIDGDLVIAQGVGNGEVHLNNINIKGKVIALGGGENSVYFNNANVEGALAIRKAGGNIRIVASGTSKISVITMESGAIIVANQLSSGYVGKVVVMPEVAAKQNIVLKGNFAAVENNAAGIKIQAEGKIENVVLNQAVEVSGTAEIKNIKNNSISDSVVNGKTIESEKKTTNDKTNSDADKNKGGSSSGGSSGGGSSSGESSAKYTVKFESNGGTEVGAIQAESGKTINAPTAPTKAKTAGEPGQYSFVGWYKDPQFKNLWNFATDKVTENITLYAKWGTTTVSENDDRFAPGYPKLVLNN